MLHALLSLLAPDDCLVCDVEGAALCVACADTLPYIRSRCFMCLEPTQHGATCNDCYKITQLDAVHVATVYKGAIKNTLYEYKYSYRRSVAVPLARLLKNRCPQTLTHDSVVTYVPTTAAHVRIRGFDHARLLARQYARLCNTTALPTLQRASNTAQVGASRHTRLKNMEHAFTAQNTDMYKNKTIIVVDDVITTGATAIAVAKTLKAAGAKRVVLVVIAQTCM